MRYKVPKLYRIFPLHLAEAVCADGAEASLNPPSCKAGPEAGGGGCEAGTAAASRCLPGAAAGSACDSGIAFE